MQKMESAGQSGLKAIVCLTVAFRVGQSSPVRSWTP
jgi:hypothetical protein